MLQLISSTLTDNTAKLVETHLKEQIKSQVIPSISRIVENAVGMQIAKGIADALAVVRRRSPASDRCNCLIFVLAS